MPRPAVDLGAICADTAADLDGVGTDRTGGVVAYDRAGQVFARVDAASLEVRLPDDIAEAALRTPDTLEVPGEPGWIRLVPTEAASHVTDRARAWFVTAWRHAGT